MHDKTLTRQDTKTLTDTTLTDKTLDIQSRACACFSSLTLLFNARLMWAKLCARMGFMCAVRRAVHVGRHRLKTALNIPKRMLATRLKIEMSECV